VSQTACGRRAIVTVTLNPAIDQTVYVKRLVPGSVHRGACLQISAGGKGINVAGCLSDYGVPVIATGLLGADNAGIFQELFASKGIEDRFVYVPGRTRINIKIVDRTADDTTDVNTPAPAVPAFRLTALKRCLTQCAAQSSWAVLAGSLPTGLDPAIYRDWIALFKSCGVPVILDTSDAALAATLAPTTAQTDWPDVIKPNLAELERLMGRALRSQNEVLEAARELRDRGIARVVVSLGAAGAIFLDAESTWLAVPPKVPVASTVGAGDALVAGLAASLYEGRPWDECARRAVAFAAAKLQRVGPHLPSRPRLDSLAVQVKLTQLG
jgi:1-phosphofructokinase